MTKIIIVGAKGRMGQAIDRISKGVEGAEVVARIDVGDSLEDVLPKGDVVIDFSHHSCGVAVAQATAKEGKALVVGTTGHSAEDKAAILAVGTQIPVIFSPNYSIGVNVLFHLTREAARLMWDADQEIIEMHHNKKKDAPSGTAARLIEILLEEKKKATGREDILMHGREGEVGARTQNEIGVHSLRGGDVVGDHTVMFASLFERVELTHKASSRDAFAIGAIRAALWLHRKGKTSGVYEMADVLGLR